VKDNGQTFLADGQSYANKVAHENIAKIKGQDIILAKSAVKAENRS